ncbi:MAG: restriction endonuclease subunit S [Bacteroidetes bacterium]|nr:restriction endonuclease subunit S [Bacteroidota bacterium]
MIKKTNTLIPEIRFPEFINDGDWEEKKLNKLGNLINGLTYSPNDVREKGLLVLRSSNVQNGQIVLNDTVYVMPEIKGANLTQAEDILVCIRNGSKTLIGKNAIIPKDIPLATHGAFMTVFRAEHPKFVFQLFQTVAYSKQVNADLGATINSINGKNFLKYKFIVPKPREQQKIASCLSSLDNIIAAQGQKLGALQEHKKGLMQNLFPQEGETIPKYRFPEFVNDNDWVEKTFEELFIIGNGRDYKHLDKGKIPVYGSGGRMRFVNDYLYDGESACIGRKGTIDKPMFLSGKFWTVDTLFYTHSFKDCLPKFIYYIFQNINWIKHNEAGGVPSLSKTNIYKIATYIPKPREQQKLVDCISSLDILIKTQEEKMEQLKLHKKGLMQGIFPQIND